jgi:CHAT domain-containing protein
VRPDGVLLLGLLGAGDLLGPEGPDPGDRFRASKSALDASVAAGDLEGIARFLESFPEGAVPLADERLVEFLRGPGVDRRRVEEARLLAEAFARVRPESELPAHVERLASLDDSERVKWREGLASLGAPGGAEDWADIAERFSALGDSRRESWARVNRGFLLLEGEDWPAAREALERARSIAVRLGDSPAEARAVEGLLRWASESGDEEVRKASLERLFEIGGRLESARALGEANRRLAVLESRGGAAARAIPLFEKAIDLLDRAGAEALAARALAGRGTARASTGDFEAGLGDLRAARERLAELGEAKAVADALASEAHWTERAGLPDSLARWAEAAEAMRKTGFRGREAPQTFRSLGRRFYEVGEYEKAANLFEEAARLDEAHPGVASLAEDKSCRAGALLGLGRREEARSLALEAIGLARRGAAEAAESFAWRVLGELDASSGRFDRALEALDRSLSLAESKRDVALVAGSAVTLGHLHARLGRKEEASRFYDRAMSGPPEARDVALFGRASLAVGEGRLEEAAADYGRLAGRGGTPLLRSYAASELALLRALQGREAEAKEYLEKAAGASLPDLLVAEALVEARLLSARGEAREAAEVLARACDQLAPGADANLEMTLHAELAAARLDDDRPRDALETCLAADGLFESMRPADLREPWKPSLQARFANLAEVSIEAAWKAGETGRALAFADAWRGRALVEAISSRAARAPSPEQARTLVARVRSHLGGDTALLAYAASREDEIANVVSEKRIEVFHLGPKAEVEEAAREARMRMLAPAGAARAPEYVEAGARLHGLLLGPLGSALEGIERLVVVPDERLAGVAFEALVTARVPRADGFGELPYVLDRFAVRYAPSASAFVAAAAKPKSAADRFLVLGDPAYGAAAPALVLALRGFPDSALGRLPRSRGEAEGVAALLGGDSGVDLWLGEGARRSRLLAADLLRYRVLHFAAHAIADVDSPASSGLLLAPEGSDVEATLLSVEEVERLDLDADLVVLSACETNLGPRARGEGVLSLARAFLRAGARAVLASEWKVADEAAAEIALAFHAKARSAPLDVALREAKRSRLRRLTEEPRPLRGTEPPGPAVPVDPAHPFFWAPLVLVGG